MALIYARHPYTPAIRVRPPASVVCPSAFAWAGTGIIILPPCAAVGSDRETHENFHTCQDPLEYGDSPCSGPHNARSNPRRRPGSATRPPRGGQSLDQLTGESERPLQITRFGVGGYTFDGRTNDNTFTASKLAVALFRELSESVWVFGQLTTLLEGHHEEAEEGGGGQEEEGGEGVVTEIEIDNFIVNFTPPGATGVSLFLGKFDSPLGFERDDEPLNLQSTTSFNFEFGRPIKFVGLGGRWNISPRIDLLAMVTNGWESQIDPNRGKTIGARLGVLLTESTTFGVGGTFGPEGEQDEADDRHVISVDYSWQPNENLIVAGEGNWGADHLDGANANWIGGTVTIFGRLHRSFGVTVRGEVFDDMDGARTGEVQSLKSFSFAPVYFIGAGRSGIFSNIEHTTFRIPRFQIRGEVRLDHSSIDFFETSGGPDDWAVRYILQLVATF